jgi:hypothetical protein
MVPSMYHVIEIVLTTVGIVALVCWWEWVCRLGCADRFHHFYFGIPLIFLSYQFHTSASVIIQVMGTGILVDSAYMAYRQNQQTPRERSTVAYHTPLFNAMLWCYGHLKRVTAHMRPHHSYFL